MTDYSLEGVDLKGMKLDQNHADFKALQAVARDGGWDQKSFARVVQLEVDRVSANAKPAAPAPPPAAAPAPAKVEGWDKMSSFQRMAHAVAASDAKRKEQSR